MGTIRQSNGCLSFTASEPRRWSSCEDDARLPNYCVASSDGLATLTTGPLVRVDPGGAIFRGLAVPFNESALLNEGGRVFAEQFDDESIRSLPTGIPLLVAHRLDSPPVGIVTSSGISRYGLGVEGRFVVR